MFTGYPVSTRVERDSHAGIWPTVHCVLAVVVACKHPKASQVFFKGTSSTEVDGVSTSGVDFWHAVEFSRNGRFLCTHPLGLSSGLFPSVLRFRLYQTVSGPDFLGA